ncbi:S8 family serine peptidase [Longispora urticae]
MNTRRSLAVPVALLAALVATAPPAVAQTPTPTGPVLVPAGAELVPDSYIVTLDDAAAKLSRSPARAAVGSVAGDLAGRHGGTVRRVYSSALHGFSARMTAAQARALAADPRVAGVRQDTVGHSDAAPWNLDRVDQRSLPLSTTYTAANTGAGVNVYIIDSGIRMSHQDFGGRAVSGYDFVDNDTDASDCLGHGTHVAGTVAGTAWGAAKGAKVYSVRVIDCNDSASDSDTLAAIDWVTENAVKPAIVNMSMHSSAGGLDEAVRNSIASGITYTVAAGNQTASACGQSPARVPEAITVGNTTNTDARRSDSNYGTCLDLFAPGSDITSASHTSDTGTRILSGTSMSAPLVAGAAAMYLATNPTASPRQVRDALVGCATPDKVTGAGTGSPNLLLFVPCGAAQPASYENATDVPVPDWSTATGAITVSGRSGPAPAALKVAVEVRHPYRGDVALTLVAPDGSTYVLKTALMSDLADDVVATYTVDASGEAADGVWQLRVQDTVGFDTGYLDRWSLTF